jgi:hypothetical protein
VSTSRRALAAAAGIAALACAAPAAAGAATWHQVTPSAGRNIDEVGLVRTSDGVLHVAWVQANAAASARTDVATRTVTPDGTTLGPVALIADGWAAASNPALTTGPGGLRAFFGGIRTTNAGEPNSNLNTASSPDGGSSWSLQLSNVSNGPAAYASSMAATLLPGDVPMTAWGSSPGTFVTTGLSVGGPLLDVQAELGGNFGYDAGLATDASGTPYVAWASNATGKLGPWAQALTPSVTPAGPPMLMPGVLGSDFSQQLQRTPIAARAGGGVYMAYPGGYPTATKVVLWKVGESSSTVVASGPGDHHATVTADGDGRLWIVWSEQGRRVRAVRTNKTASAFGAVVNAGAPKGTSSIYKVDASATSDGAVDVFALSDAGADATWQARLLPGLTLKAKPSTLKRGKATSVTFTVLDAGDPVSGATVKAGGLTGTTGAAGTAKLSLFPGKLTKKIKATASRGGYVAASVTLKTKK